MNFWSKNTILCLCIVFSSFLGSYFLGKSVEEDYARKPGFDAAEARWSIIEAYSGGALLFGSVGALAFYIASIIIKKSS